MRRVALWTAPLFILALLGLSACGGGSGGSGGEPSAPAGAADGGAEQEVTVTFWHAIAQQHEAALSQIIQAFEQENPWITIEATSKGGYVDLNTALMTAMPTRNRPVIAQVYESWTAQYLEADVIVPVQRFLDDDGDFGDEDLADFYPPFLQNNIWNGEIVTLPFNKSLYLLFVNLDLLEAEGLGVPETWQQMREASLALTEGDRKGIGFRPLVESFTTLFFMNGGEYLGPNGEPLLDQTPSIETVEYLAALRWEDNSMLVESNYLSSAFAGQNVGMFIGSSAGIPYVEGPVGDTFRWTTAPLPSHGDATRNVLSQGTNVAIFEGHDAATQQAAWEFLKFLTNSENTALFATISGYLPVRRSAVESPEYLAYLAENPYLRAAADELEHAAFEPRLPQWEGARDELNRSIGQLFASSIDDPAAFAQRMNTAVAEALAE
jgi:multiple sugar transport system substrate-binding protein